MFKQNTWSSNFCIVFPIIHCNCITCLDFFSYCILKASLGSKTTNDLHVLYVSHASFLVEMFYVSFPSNNHQKRNFTFFYYTFTIFVSFSKKGPRRRTIALKRGRTPKQYVLHLCKTRIWSDQRLVHTWNDSLPVCSFLQRLQHVAAAAASGLIMKDALLSSSKLDPRGVRRCGNRDNLLLFFSLLQ